MTSITHWTPFNRSNVWPFDFWSDIASVRERSFAPSRLGLDVIQNTDSYTIEASLPGFAPEDIDITVDNGLLRIAADKSSDETHQDGKYLIRERKHGKFHRAIRLPDGINVDAAATSYKNGVLQINLPKNDAGNLKKLSIAA